MARAVVAIEANATGRAIGRRRATVRHIVSLEMKARTEAGEVVQPEEALAHPCRLEDVSRFVRLVAQQAVDRKRATAAGRKPPKSHTNRAWLEHAKVHAVQHDTQRPRLIVPTHSGPPCGGMEMHVIPSQLSKPRALTPDTELQAAGVFDIVVVTEGDVQVGPQSHQGGAQAVCRIRLKIGANPHGAVDPVRDGAQPRDHVKLRAQVMPRSPAFGATGDDIMRKRVEAADGYVRVGVQIVAH